MNQEEIGKQVLLRRLWAFCVDTFLIFAIKEGLFYSYMNFIKAFFYQLQLSQQKSIIEHLSNLNPFLTFATFMAYFTISYYWGHGKTVGKLIFHISVVPENYLEAKSKKDLHLSFFDAFARSVGYVICYLSALVLYALPLIRKDRRGIPDYLSKTVVASDKQIQEILHQSPHSTDENVEQLPLPFNEDENDDDSSEGQAA